MTFCWPRCRRWVARLEDRVIFCGHRRFHHGLHQAEVDVEMQPVETGDRVRYEAPQFTLNAKSTITIVARVKMGERQ